MRRDYAADDVALESLSVGVDDRQMDGIRNADCDDYYNRYGSYYGSPYCDAYDYRTGYCG